MKKDSLFFMLQGVLGVFLVSGWLFFRSWREIVTNPVQVVVLQDKVLVGLVGIDGIFGAKNLVEAKTIIISVRVLTL